MGKRRKNKKGGGREKKTTRGRVMTNLILNVGKKIFLPQSVPTLFGGKKIILEGGGGGGRIYFFGNAYPCIIYYL